MMQAGQDLALDAILKHKYDLNKTKAVSFFARIYYNAALNYITREYKPRLRAEGVLKEGTELRPRRKDKEANPFEILAPILAWVLEGKGAEINKRFLAMIQINYPELSDKESDETTLNHYAKTFPTALEGHKVKKFSQRNKITDFMGDINNLRRKCNTHNDFRNEGLRNNLKGLSNIIEKRLGNVSPARN
jgi:hypothetical protein